jgi:hypothetical protein
MKITPTMLAVVMPPKSGKKSKITATEPTPATADRDSYKEPSPAERTVSRAHDAKVSATDSWVRGEISNAKHDQIHSRANKVIKAKGCIK